VKGEERREPGYKKEDRGKRREKRYEKHTEKRSEKREEGNEKREEFNAKTKIIFSFRIKRMLLVFVN
jgi:hypothetical protein